MPNLATPRRAVYFAALLLSILFISCQNHSPYEEEKEGEYDGPEEAIRQEIEMTRDLATGRVPWEKLLAAKLATEDAKETARQQRLSALNWEERGPNA
ncbi:MAG: hypothetical protein KGO46_07885, partial [Bacteroidetes bacterium]|nr:hypothetical protein [Bacteroidota bacterium]